MFRSNLKFDQNLQCSSLKCAQRNTKKFCTCHDSVTVVMCAKFYCDWFSIFKLEHSKFWSNSKNSVSGTGAWWWLLGDMMTNCSTDRLMRPEQYSKTYCRRPFQNYFLGFNLVCWINLIANKTTFIPIMAWYHRAKSHYMKQYWLRSEAPHIASLGHNGLNKLQWIKKVYRQE